MNIIPHWLDRFEGIQQTGKGWQVRCPSHDDRQASLSIDPARKGWLLYCHRGCDTHHIMAEIGLRMTDLYYDAQEYGKGRNPDHATAERKAKEFFNEGRSPDLCWKLHTFKDIAWEALPVEEEAFVLAYVEYDKVFEPFENGMKEWISLSGSWGSAWLSEAWAHGHGRLDWIETMRWLNRNMWRVYVEKGCSGSTCGANRNPVPVQTRAGYITRQSTQPGSGR